MATTGLTTAAGFSQFQSGATTEMPMYSTTPISVEANSTSNPYGFDNPFRDVPLDSNFAWLLCALSCVCAWMIYGSCFHSRVAGLIVGWILNQYFRLSGLGEIRIGSLKLGVVSGRLAFRDVSYITEDYTLLIYDGYLVFRYWIPYFEKPLADFRNQPHRLFINLYGVEYYVYHRKEPVAELKLRNNSYANELYNKIYGDDGNEQSKADVGSPGRKDSNESKIRGPFCLRSLFSIVDIKLSVFRMVLGNLHAPYSLVVGFSSGTLMQTYESPADQVDPYSTVISGTLKNLEASFAANPDYVGEHPKCPYDKSDAKGKYTFLTGEIVQVNRYVVDTPTDILTMLPDAVSGETGQLMQWSLQLTLLGRTDIVYGSWFDSRRYEVHKAIFPPGRTEQPVSRPSSERLYSGFDLRINSKSTVYFTLYLLDIRQQVQKFMLSGDPGTEFHIFVPYILMEDGYTTCIESRITRLRGVTSLAAKNFVEAEELALDFQLKYSRVHHGPQDWLMNYSWKNACVFLLFEHKKMVADLIGEWSGGEKPDLLKFTPYKVQTNMNWNQFDLITYANQFNWIDCSRSGLENSLVAFHGANMKLDFHLDFMEFTPNKNAVPFSLDATDMEVKMLVPETSAQSPLINVLYKNANVETADKTKLNGSTEPPPMLRDPSKPDQLWCRAWMCQRFRFGLNYQYFTNPLLDSAIRMHAADSDRDLIEVEITVDQSQVLLSGALLRSFYMLKENYFGSNQVFASLEDNVPQVLEELLRKTLIPSRPGEAAHRPLELNFVGRFSDATCHLLRPCDFEDAPCPRFSCQLILVEVMKRYEQTMIQILCQPLVLTVTEEEAEDVMQAGQILVSYLQFRGHAMFSDVEVPVNDDTIEYAWLMDLQIGDVVSRTSLPQMAVLVEALQCAALTASAPEDALVDPNAVRLCQHNQAQPLCSASSGPFGLCPAMQDIKYTMNRMSLDSLSVYLNAKDSVVHLQIETPWFSTCSMSSENSGGGGVLLLPDVVLRHYVWSHVTPLADQDVWLEVTHLSTGPIDIQLRHGIELADSFNQLQLAFLKKHDVERRLFFLWDDSSKLCACFGGSSFFGCPFSDRVWKHYQEAFSKMGADNDEGFSPGRLIFSDNDADSTMSFLSLDKIAPRRSGVQIREKPAETSVASSAGARRRPSTASFDSFYSAAENPDSSSLSARLQDKTSLAGLSQVTISTISLAPHTVPTAAVEGSASFPVNLHAQLLKPTQDSPLLVAGYPSYLALWQREVTDVPISDGESTSAQRFYMPAFTQVRSGFAVELRKKSPQTPVAKLPPIPRHYRSVSEAAEDSWKSTHQGNSQLASDLSRSRVGVQFRGIFHLTITPMTCDAILPLVASISKHKERVRPYSELFQLYQAAVADALTKHAFNEDNLTLSKFSQNIRPSSAQDDLHPTESKISRLQSVAGRRVFNKNAALMDGKLPERPTSPKTNGSLFGVEPFMEKVRHGVELSLLMEQMNVVAIQCGIIEELVTTRDLSSPRELMAISNMTCSLRSFHLSLCRDVIRTTNARIFVDRRGSRPSPSIDRAIIVQPLSPLSGIFNFPDVVGAETDSVTETNTIVSASIDACHGQLRRLKHSDAWKRASVTYIDEKKSQVWFDYRPQTPTGHVIDEGNAAADRYGFVVLEAGVDDIKLEGGGTVRSDGQIAVAPSASNPSPKNDSGHEQASDRGDGSGHTSASSSAHTFIAHHTDELASACTRRDFKGLKLRLSIGGTWLQCPTPAKGTNATGRSSVLEDDDATPTTRRDWHFLSTSNPSVDSWLYPIDRLSVAIQCLAAEERRRRITTAAYFLIRSVNEHILPNPSKWKMSRQTIKGRILHEDSCLRLARIILRHGLAASPADLASEVRVDKAPPVDVLERSIFVLFKQLRYTPFARTLQETQSALPKAKSPFRPGTMHPRSRPAPADIVQELDLTMLDNDVDETFLYTEPPARKHVDSPYPPLEQDLNAWLNEETLRKTSPQNKSPPVPRADYSHVLEDSDSPWEDAEGSPLFTHETEGSPNARFSAILSHIGLLSEPFVSTIKSFTGPEATLTLDLDFVRIDLVPAASPAAPSADVLDGDNDRQTACKLSGLQVVIEALLDISPRMLDTLLPTEKEVFASTGRGALSIVIYQANLTQLTQVVSMPLLRLLAQINTVIENMQRVRSELNDNWPGAIKRGHRKTDSTSTGGSGTSRSDSPGQPRAAGYDTYTVLTGPESSKHWRDLMMLMDLYAKPSSRHQVIDETAVRLDGRIPAGARFSRHRLSMGKKRRSSSDLVTSSGKNSEVQDSPVLGGRKEFVVGEDDSPVHPQHSMHTITENPAKTAVENALKRRRLKLSRYSPRFILTGSCCARDVVFEASLRGLMFQAGLGSVCVSQSLTGRKSRTSHVVEKYIQLRTSPLSIQLCQKMDSKSDARGQIYLESGLASSCLVYSAASRNNAPLGQRSLVGKLGEIFVAVPHHPITLHAMAVKGAEDLTAALSDLKNTTGVKFDRAATKTVVTTRKVSREVKAIHPIKTSVHFKRITITAAPLPSLQASYEISKIWACGVTGQTTTLQIELCPQELRFKSVVGAPQESSAKFKLPAFNFKASYEPVAPIRVRNKENKIVEYVDVKALFVTAKTGSPEYSFNTDILKYSVLFQKVFMRELEDVIDTLTQPMPSQPAPFKLRPESKRSFQDLPFFYQVNIQQDGIRVTGATPTNSAVRLEIDKTAIYLANLPRTDAVLSMDELHDTSVVSVQLDLGICLGQLVQVEQEMYEEAKPDFQPCAHFRTRMTFTNYGDGPLEALLVGYDPGIKRKRIVTHLSQPRIYMQPKAVDMAVIFYINYKNAYDYWYEQRHETALASSPRGHMRATRLQSAHLPQVVAQRAMQTIQESIHVIELFISQMYICMPFPTGKFSGTERDADSAALLSLDRTKIRAVLAESIITSGSFDLFRLCFTEDRGPQYDYTSRPEAGMTNCCFVPKGFVQVTSRTIKKETVESALPKWELYFKWDMNGIEMHIDPSIGKIVSNISDAMMALSTDDTEAAAKARDQPDSTDDGETIEKQMQLHAKIFNDMKNEGAPAAELQSEAEKLKRLERNIATVLRKDLVNRIRQKSMSRSSSEYRSHRRTSSTPQNDLSPSSPAESPSYNRALSVDWNRPGSAPTPVFSETYSTPQTSPTQARANSLTVTSAPETESAFDLDFTVLINIESGHCTLYSSLDKEAKRRTHLTGTNSASLADVTRLPGLASARRGSDLGKRASLQPCCTLYIPGVNLEMQYESDTITGPRTVRSPQSPNGQSRLSSMFTSTQSTTQAETSKPISSVARKKKGSFFATCSLESIPAETVLSPQLLNFIEQALEPIPMMQRTSQPPASKSESSETKLSGEKDEPWSLDAAVDSFPVDVFILFMMNSTKIRCTCLPVSKVEGVLTLPSLNLMLSTRRQNTPKLLLKHDPVATGRVKDVLRKLDDMVSSAAVNTDVWDMSERFDEHHGMALYGNLAGFSLVIYHPYGTVSDSYSFDSPDKTGKGNYSQLGSLLPDKRELVRLDLDRLHVDIVRSKSLLVDDKASSDVGTNSIQFAALMSIGKTTFWYDLRRLGEILAFPRAWYRRAIARRFFLGEETADSGSTSESLSGSDSGVEQHVDDDFGEEEQTTPTTEHPASDLVHPWQTLVLVGVSIASLDINVNMGNVMGNTILLVEDINSIGRYSAAYDGLADMFIGMSAGVLDLNSRGGVVGGSSNWRKAQVYGHFRTEPNMAPLHSFGCMMYTAETKLEYMGAVSVLARMSKLNVRIKDEWSLGRFSAEGKEQLLARVFGTWDQMQFIICSASTSHVVKSVVRVSEFFEEQLKSSRQFISTLNFGAAAPPVGRRRSSLSRGRDTGSNWDESHFHRHWQSPLAFLRNYRLRSLPSCPFPDWGGVLKGKIDMNGSHVSLACFYGNSFRGKQWARFSIREPKLLIECQSFSERTENSDGMISVEQLLRFSLGKDELDRQAATVARVTCNNAPPLLNLPDWFEFMFMNSELDEISRFPTAYSSKVSALEDVKLNMTIETILALPKLTISLKSGQQQTIAVPAESDAPLVACNFQCDFGAPISIDMADSQAFYFLHQLINSYLANTDAESVASKRGVPNPTEVLKADARSFQVNEWYLQPSFKLLQRIGRDIETIGVERVMTRLGFSHAQTTIPKWIQRGLIDPADKGLAWLTLLILHGSRHIHNPV